MPMLYPQVAVYLFFTSVSLGQTPPDEHFEKKIRPLFVERCQKCHGDLVSRNGLRLDSSVALQKGGKRGKALVPLHPETSLLIQAVKRQGELKMPPDGPLSTQQIADLELWIKQGAVFSPPTTTVRTNSLHWSFQPLNKTAIVPVKNNGWGQNPVDALVLEKLEKADLQPSPEANKSTLIRRVCFDLTGLPPTMPEIEAYQSDNSSAAYEAMVNRYLATPAYGERWGRHWLDVARYADSNGLDENVAHGNAWRYRDYVVGAFNKNMPYNQFLIEQLAGDLLPSEEKADKHSRLIATGFLSLGPKVLAEVDKQKMEMDIIDEQIDTLGKTILGMTLGCARCHDHKFDPILTGEYYSLAGVFKSTKTMESFITIAKWNENAIGDEKDMKRIKDHADQVATLTKKTDAYMEAQGTLLITANKLPKDKKPTPKEVEALLLEPAKTYLKKLREEAAALEKSVPEVPSAMGVTEGKVTDVAIHIRGNTDRLGKVMPHGVPEVLAVKKQPTFPTQSSGRLELARWIASEANPLTARVMVNRVWRWHFGQGIVSTVDNFGLLGAKPTHPELLDWLANYFIQNKWSIKDLHRVILFSKTYRQESRLTAEISTKDPAGSLYARFTPRRFEGEVLRDALLAVSGQLDNTMGGSLLQVKNRAFFFDHTSKDLTKYDSNRRSIYLPVVRNNLYEVFSLFDGTDAAVANGDRANTTIAPQALFFLNSNLVMDAARAIAKKATQVSPSVSNQLGHLYEAALGRKPTPAERASGELFLEQAMKQTQTNQQALSALSQVILASNEFVTQR